MAHRVLAASFRCEINFLALALVRIGSSRSAKYKTSEFQQP
jgi:hypothetical protein